eukprot:SAG31_NODE_337_length_17493_cov_5.855755_10_plen_352_part_00
MRRFRCASEQHLHTYWSRDNVLQARPSAQQELVELDRDEEPAATAPGQPIVGTHAPVVLPFRQRSPGGTLLLQVVGESADDEISKQILASGESTENEDDHSQSDDYDFMRDNWQEISAIRHRQRGNTTDGLTDEEILAVVMLQSHARGKASRRAVAEFKAESRISDDRDSCAKRVARRKRWLTVDGPGTLAVVGTPRLSGPEYFSMPRQLLEGADPAAYWSAAGMQLVRCWNIWRRAVQTPIVASAFDSAVEPKKRLSPPAVGVLHIVQQQLFRRRQHLLCRAILRQWLRKAADSRIRRTLLSRLLDRRERVTASMILHEWQKQADARQKKRRRAMMRETREAMVCHSWCF